MLEPIGEIKQRCAAAGFEFEERNPRNPERSNSLWVFKVPKGRDLHEITLEDEIVAQLIAGEPFEEYVRLSGYEASWSRKHQIIECTLSRSGRPLFGRNLTQIFRRLGQDLDPSQVSLTPEQRVEFSSATSLTSVSVGASSNVHAVLTNNVRRPFHFDLEEEPEDPEEEDPEVYFRRVPTLRIEGTTVETHDGATRLLERVGNSLLFQLDLSLEIPLTLARERERSRRRTRPPATLDQPPPISYEYDSEAMTLYWYAKSAAEMPLLQFLAYYQVIEFYFPTYSRIEAQNTLRNILKDPTFNLMRDTDISRLLESVKVSAGGKAYGNEVHQLGATIQNCVTPYELRVFLDTEENEDRHNFYTSDQAKKVVRDRIRVRGNPEDLPGDAAKRIYAIRNRIVHTKHDYDDQEMLLPFDPETKYLHHDIELVEFLARKVLIASSRPLQI